MVSAVKLTTLGFPVPVGAGSLDFSEQYLWLEMIRIIQHRAFIEGNPTVWVIHLILLNFTHKGESHDSK